MLAEWLEREGLDENTAAEIAGANTARQALDILRGAGRLEFVGEVGRRMLPSARKFAGPKPDLWAMVIDYDGAVLFQSRQEGQA